VGDSVGSRVGVFVGLAVGDAVGSWVGAFVGLAVGDFVGLRVGAFVGLFVGDGVGAGVSHLFTPRMQIPLPQSLPMRQLLPASQRGQPSIRPPPQSTSVSEPPFAPSAQDCTVGLNVGALVGSLVGC